MIYHKDSFIITQAADCSIQILRQKNLLHEIYFTQQVFILILSNDNTVPSCKGYGNMA